LSISADVLTRLPPEPYKTISRRVRNGDLLLCSAYDPFSKLIRWATKSPWSHVAIAYRWPALRRIMAFEAVQTIGVHAVPLQTFIRQSSSGRKPYPGKIILARHADFAVAHGKPSEASAKRFADFAVDRVGDKFASAEVAKIGLRVALGRFERRAPKFMGPSDAFICSEYVAKCFERIGIKIPWDGHGFIAPCDFANDPKINAIARFRTG
jgi:hypothetical protein